MATATTGWKRADQLAVGDWFRTPPGREGRAPAVVVEVREVRDGHRYLTVGDGSDLSPWTAVYPVALRVELCEPADGAGPIFREVVKAGVDTGGTPIEVLGFTAGPPRVEIQIGPDRVSLTSRDEVAEARSRLGRAMSTVIRAWGAGSETYRTVNDRIRVETGGLVITLSVGGGRAVAEDAESAAVLRRQLTAALERAAAAVPWRG